MELAGAHLDRHRRHEALSARLAELSDDGLGALLAESGAWRTNIHGNQSGAIEIDGAKVFVKKLALTELEAANPSSTANMFDLPLFYHYGVGSSGFGVWRELDACLRASAWALSGEGPHFPLVHHWRVLRRPAPAPPTPGYLARLERGMTFWEQAQAIRARLEAIRAATSSIVLFMEHAPDTLQAWLEARTADQPLDTEAEAAILRIYNQWRAAAAFMNDRGMLHFDLHRENLLTDGERVYVADFGLAICEDFDLAPAERAFFETHRRYDRCYVDRAFTEWLAPEADPRAVLAPALLAQLEQCAPVATLFGAFLDALINGSKSTPYPASELEAALAAQSADSAPG